MYIEQEIEQIKCKANALNDKIQKLETELKAMKISGGARINCNQPISQKMRDVIKEAKDRCQDFEIKFIKVHPSGFYQYNLKHRGNAIKFIIEPSLLPAYDYIIKDMMERHNRTPHESYVDNPQMKTPLSDIDEAIKKVSEYVSNLNPGEK